MKKVSLFIPCLIDGLFPEAGAAVVRVLERLGAALEYPEDQTCCGQPAYNAGFQKEAAVAARRFLDVFDHAEAVVCPSGSCTAMVRNHYPTLFAHDPVLLQRARRMGKKIFEFTEFLTDELGVVDVGARFNGAVTYHDSCHQARELGIRGQPRALLRAVAGLELIEMRDSDTCCGFGGAFSVKYPDISESLLADKVDNVLASGADAVVGCDAGCLLGIKGMLHRRKKNVRVLHIAQVLASEG